MVSDAGWQLFFVVGHHDEGLVATQAEGFDDVLHELSVGVVEAVKWLVENKQLGVLHKGACQ